MSVIVRRAAARLGLSAMLRPLHTHTQIFPKPSTLEEFRHDNALWTDKTIGMPGSVYRAGALHLLSYAAIRLDNNMVRLGGRTFFLSDCVCTLEQCSTDVKLLSEVKVLLYELFTDPPGDEVEIEYRAHFLKHVNELGSNKHKLNLTYLQEIQDLMLHPMLHGLVARTTLIVRSIDFYRAHSHMLHALDEAQLYSDYDSDVSAEDPDFMNQLISRFGPRSSSGKMTPLPQIFVASDFPRYNSIMASSVNEWCSKTKIDTGYRAGLGLLYRNVVVHLNDQVGVSSPNVNMDDDAWYDLEHCMSPVGLDIFFLNKLKRLNRDYLAVSIPTLCLKYRPQPFVAI